MNRNTYGEITAGAPKWVESLLIDAERAGCWTTGIDSDSKKRGSAINCALYGFKTTDDGDLAVVQIRECRFRPGRFNKVRKDWYLVGRVESGAVFTHPIDSPIRSKLAANDHEYCVDYVLSKIWNCKIDALHDIIRQGDVALIPIVNVPTTAAKFSGNQLLIRDTHILTGEIWTQGAEIFCKRNATLRHSKNEHKTIKAKSGYYRVQPGYRASVWGFSKPTAD